MQKLCAYEYLYYFSTLFSPSCGKPPNRWVSVWRYFTNYINYGINKYGNYSTAG